MLQFDWRARNPNRVQGGSITSFFCPSGVKPTVGSVWKSCTHRQKWQLWSHAEDKDAARIWLSANGRTATVKGKIAIVLRDGGREDYRFATSDLTFRAKEDPYPTGDGLQAAQATASGAFNGLKIVDNHPWATVIESRIN